MEKDRIIRPYSAIVVGGSAGSLDVLFKLLPKLRPDLPHVIIVVLHRKSSSDSSLTDLLASKTTLPVREVEDKDAIRSGHIYLAPSDYHLLIEKDLTFSLDYSEKVNFSRPSLDVTFESVADIFTISLTGIILSGANEDGTNGLRAIRNAGGTIIAQDPATAQMPVMPQNAISHLQIDRVLDITEMSEYINTL